MIKLIKHSLKKLISPKYIYLKRFSVQPGDVVIDLGANVGEVTEYFARKKSNVFAYEPNPHAFKILNKYFNSYKNVTLQQAAVASYNGRGKLWLHEKHNISEIEFSQASSLQSEKGNVSKDAIDVTVINIADVLAEHKSIRLLKIDIEGGEYDIIDHILEMAYKIDFILLETHGQKHTAFAKKEYQLQDKIQQSIYKEKIYTDWF